MAERGRNQMLRKLFSRKMIDVSEGAGVSYIVPEKVEPGTELREDGKAAELDRAVIEEHVTVPFLRNQPVEGYRPQVRVQTYEVPMEQWEKEKWGILEGVYFGVMKGVGLMILEYDGSRSVMRFFIEKLEDKVHIWCVMMIWGGK